MYLLLNNKGGIIVEQCKVNGQDIYITDLDDIYYYLRQLIKQLTIDLEEAQDKIEGLEVEADSLKKELNEARETVQELQEIINEYKYQ